MLPLEVVYAFDPVPPEPQHEEPATPMSRSGDGDSDGSGMDVESASNGMGDGGGVSVTPAYADWTLPIKDAHHIIGGQASDRLQIGWLALCSCDWPSVQGISQWLPTKHVFLPRLRP